MRRNAFGDCTLRAINQSSSRMRGSRRLAKAMTGTWTPVRRWFRANAGRLSFGDFSLATQRKVTRPPGGTGHANQIREANTNKTSRTAARSTKWPRIPCGAMPSAIAPYGLRLKTPTEPRRAARPDGTRKTRESPVTQEQRLRTLPINRSSSRMRGSRRLAKAMTGTRIPVRREP
jgi:hypothetical protein